MLPRFVWVMIQIKSYVWKVFSNTLKNLQVVMIRLRSTVMIQLRRLIMTRWKMYHIDCLYTNSHIFTFIVLKTVFPDVSNDTMEPPCIWWTNTEAWTSLSYKGNFISFLWHLQDIWRYRGKSNLHLGEKCSQKTSSQSSLWQACRWLYQLLLYFRHKKQMLLTSLSHMAWMLSPVIFSYRILSLPVHLHNLSLRSAFQMQALCNLQRSSVVIKKYSLW